MLNLILASTQDNGIGRDNALPWHYPADLKVFKAITEFNPIVMGSNTWESLPFKPLKNRQHYVLTSKHQMFNHPEVFFINKDNLHFEDDKNYWVIGGAQTYRLLAPKCTYIHHTLINRVYECDTFFNVHDCMDLELVSEDAVGTDSELIFRLFYNRRSARPRSQTYEKELTALRRRSLGIEKET